MKGSGNFGFYGSMQWQRILVWLLFVGFFIQLSGKVWIESSSARNTQVYIWLLLPVLIFAVVQLFFRRSVVLSWHYIPWGAFLFWVGLSTLWAVGADTHAFSLAKRGVLIALYILAAHVLMNLNELVLRRALMAGVGVIALGALASMVYQFGVLDRPLAYRAFRIDRLGFGDFANYGWPVAAGIFHGAIAIWALGFALEKHSSFQRSLFWFFVFTVLSFYVVFTYTRGAWIALTVGVLVVVVLQNSSRGWWSLAIGLAVIFSLVVLFWPQMVFEFEKRQLSGRGPIWAYYLKEMTGHWMIGHGLGTPFEYHWPSGEAISPHAHSLYLQQIYDSGVISLALFWGGLIGLLHKSWKLRTNYWVRLAFPSLVFSLVAMLTDVERIFTRPGDYWTVFWLPIAILLAVPMRSKHLQQGHQ